MSVRLSGSDRRKIKRIAERLGVNDSEIIRAAIKGMLSKLRPLGDEHSTGSRLLPVFLEHGNELAEHFDFDTEDLEKIVNHNAAESDCVEYADIELLAIKGAFPNYLQTRLETLLATSIKESELDKRFRDYMYEKYGKQRSHQADTA